MRVPGSVEAVAFALITILLGGVAPAQQSPTANFPDAPNATAVIRLGEFYDSDFAKEEGWSRESPLPGLHAVPAWVNELTLASHVLPSSASAQWVATLVPLPEGLNFATLAERATTPVEGIAGRQAFRTSHGQLAIDLGPRLLGVMRPGERQLASRWIRTLEAGSNDVPEYLTESVKAPGQFVLALDLLDAIGVPRAKEWLASHPAQLIPPAAIDPLAEAVSRTRGIQLTVVATSGLTYELRLDFKGAPGVDAAHLKTIFLAVLADLGAGIPDFADGTPAIEGESFLLRGTLSTDGLIHIATLFGAPSAQSETPPAPAASTPEARVATPAEIAEHYYTAINDILFRLQRATRRASAQSPVPVWFDNFASQIDSLDTTGVPQELIEFAGRTARNLRAIAASNRGVNVTVDAAMHKVTWDVYVEPPTVGISPWGWGWGGWGGWNYQPGRWQVNTNLGQQRATAINAIAAGQKDRDEIWGMIVDDNAETLREMRAKFGPEFARESLERRGRR